MQPRQPPLVVVAAVEQHGQLLVPAGHRAAAGPPCRLPGGPVGPDEPEAAAVVRLCWEQLGVAVVPAARLADPLPAGSPARHVWRCTVPAEPAADGPARWLAPEDLAGVEWDGADRPVVLSRYDDLMRGTPLVGGRVGGAVRVGSTVRRPTGPWTPAVHELLGHVRRAGLDGVPEVLGRDGWDREVLSYLTGDPAPTDRPASPALLADVGAWLARCHAATATFPPDPPRAWRRGAIALRPGGVVCHNDVSLHNIVVSTDAVSGERLVGVVDWDMAAPGHALDDVAFAAWQLVLRHGEAPADEAAGLAVLADGYGADPVAVLDRVVPRLRGALGFIRRGAASGDPGLATLLRSGIPEATEAGAAALQGRADAVRRLLRGSGRVGATRRRDGPPS